MSLFTGYEHGGHQRLPQAYADAAGLQNAASVILNTINMHIASHAVDQMTSEQTLDACKSFIVSQQTKQEHDHRPSTDLLSIHQ